MHLIVFVLLIPPAVPDLEPFRDPLPFAARVIGVSDGDTLTVLTAEKREVKIRLNRIDAPESKQDYGQRSKQATSDLCYGTTVRVIPKTTDHYHRTVAEIELSDGRNLNRELVREGYAWWYKEYAKGDKDLERVEKEAREAGRGLWSLPNPIPPWEFRKGATTEGPATLWVGNRSSGIYHKPGCPNGAKVSDKNRVEFATAEEAAKVGLKPGGDCHKPKKTAPQAR